MSIRTTADEHIDSATEHVRSAIKDLHEVVVVNCWGHEDLDRNNKDLLHSVYTDLLAILHRLK